MGDERSARTLRSVDPPIDAIKREEMLAVILCLHNVRTRWVGLDLIQTVYSPLWTPPMGSTRDSVIHDVFMH